MSKKARFLIAVIAIVQISSVLCENNRISLNGLYSISNANGSIKINGTIPSTIHTILENANITESIHIDDNDMKLRWVNESFS